MVKYTIDDFGRAIFNEDSIVELITSGVDVSDLYISDQKFFQHIMNMLEMTGGPRDPVNLDFDPNEYHKNIQSNPMIPDDYKNIRIEDYLEFDNLPEQYRSRAEEELRIFRYYNLEYILKSLIFIVDKMKENEVIWGVGRGSSVSSLLLFLIGIHRIDPIKYNLDFSDFLSIK